MTQYKTAQENFWSGEFGDEYIARNTLEMLPSRLAMFSDILKSTQNVDSIVEFGANIGVNLHALHTLQPEAEIHALEINEAAVSELRKQDWIKAKQGSILEDNFDGTVDLSFSCTVLIHINPEELKKAYEQLYKASRRYVLVCEYYNPAPIKISYRGEEDRLFKRDFAGDMMDLYPDLRLIDYGFVYKRDPNFPSDDFTWFLMEK